MICCGFKGEIGSIFFFSFKDKWKRFCENFARFIPEQLKHAPAVLLLIVLARQQVRLNLLLTEPELRLRNAQADGGESLQQSTVEDGGFNSCSTVLNTRSYFIPALKSSGDEFQFRLSFFFYYMAQFLLVILIYINVVEDRAPILQKIPSLFVGLP